MCIDISKYFKKPKEPVIPHPEEPEDKTKTMANTDPHEAELLWRRDWDVPDGYESGITFIMTDSYVPYGFVGYDGCPAISYDNKVYYKPSFSHGGIAAHEVSHPIWSRLTEQQKSDFDRDFNDCLVGDALMVLLDKQNSYMNTNNIEGHAEVYRYLGQYMPDILKQYYPGLF